MARRYRQVEKLKEWYERRKRDRKREKNAKKKKEEAVAAVKIKEWRKISLTQRKCLLRFTCINSVTRNLFRLLELCIL